MGLVGQLAAQTVIDSGEDLITRVRRGDAEAFRQLFERFARPIISFIYDMVGQRELAEELMQETFVRAHRSIKTLQDDTKLSTWLFGIAKNVAREALRARRRDERNIDIDDSQFQGLSDDRLPPDSELLSKELNRVIHAALAALDEDKRLVFTLKVFQHFSYEEIAEVTGFSIPKVKTDLHRAKTEVRRQIRQYQGDLGE